MLCFRLEAYDRNQNFGKNDEPEPEYYMTLPDPELYKDANADTKFCPLVLDTAVNYLEQFDKVLDNDSKKLYADRFILFFRTVKDNGKIYVKARIKAEFMKTHYDVDIAFTSDGGIIETQCECGAGMGPNGHCKHICCTLYASFKFATTGTVKLHETCTEKLQTFHQTKKFIWSPLKASKLNLQGADEFTNVDFDPRPQQFRQSAGYNDYFRNVCLNFPGVSKMPIFQLFIPANAQAVAHDHDYLRLTPEDNFLEALCVTKISKEERQQIERRTLGQDRNPLWSEERTKRLPSSMFGKICKAMASDKVDRKKLARSLVEVIKVKAPALEHGKNYEHMAISAYMSVTNHDVKKCGIVVSTAKPFIACSPDGIINDSYLVEVKCPFSAKDKPISNVTIPYLKSGSPAGYHLEETHDYYYQVQGQMYCTGAEKCDFIVYTITDMKFFQIERNDQFIVNMVKTLEKFFHEYFKPALLEKRFYKTYID